jgi:hypothetical protein
MQEHHQGKTIILMLRKVLDIDIRKVLIKKRIGHGIKTNLDLDNYCDHNL